MLASEHLISLLLFHLFSLIMLPGFFSLIFGKFKDFFFFFNLVFDSFDCLRVCLANILDVDEEQLMQQIINLIINVRVRVLGWAVVHPPLVNIIIDVIFINVGNFLSDATSHKFIRALF